MAQNFNNATRVGRESAQALLDALLVADIGKDIPEDCYLRRFPGGYMQTRLRHERQQPYGLQSHRLTASIGASNYYHEEFAPQVKVDGYNFAGQQRMAGFSQVNTSFGVQAWLSRASHTPIASFRQVQVKFGQQLDGNFEGICFVSNLKRKHTQDAFNLLAFLDL